MQVQLNERRNEQETAATPFSGGLQEMARSALKFRARRRRILGGALFADPAWDLLLVLAAGEANAWLACTEAALHAGVTDKVVERFAVLLARQGLVETVGMSGAVSVRLTAEGQQALARLIH